MIEASCSLPMSHIHSVVGMLSLRENCMPCGAWVNDQSIDNGVVGGMVGGMVGWVGRLMEQCMCHRVGCTCVHCVFV